jgi:hypothetical protein
MTSLPDFAGLVIAHIEWLMMLPLVAVVIRLTLALLAILAVRD